MITGIDDYAELADKCSHCSLCEAVCPVYLADLLETNVARARVDIINQTLCKKSMPVTRRVRDIINRCLICTSCTQSCGAAVPVHEIIITARHALYGGRRQNLFMRHFMKCMVENRGITGLPALLLLSAQKLRLAPEGFPSVKLRTFDRRYYGTYLPEGKKRAKVAYFTGCSTNTMDPDTGISVMKVLAHNGIEVVVPERLVCCGIPSLGEGDIETVQKSVRNNVNILSVLDVDAIVTDCTSCGMMLRIEAPKTLPEGDPCQAKAVRMAEKVFEVTDYLNTIGIVADPGPVDESYTYHVPCHRGWTPGMNAAPLQLLANIPGLKYKAMEEPEKCCGAGGSFFLDYTDLARKIRKRKAEDIANSGARVVISQCPGCRSYLSPVLGKGQEIVHPITMLLRSYRY